MNKQQTVSPLNIIVLAGCVLSGGFHEYVSCLLSVALAVYLAVRAHKQGYLTVKLNLTSLAVAVICAGYAVSCFWAVDTGMAWIGFCKFLPALLYMVSLWQAHDRQQLQRILPAFGAVTVIVGVIGMHISALSPFFSVAGRLAGFFQYPNTYALFLLVCELMLFAQPILRKRSYLVAAVLVIGLLYTGSRTVFVLLILSNLVLALLQRRKLWRVVLTVAAVAVLFAVLVLLLGQNTVLYRYLHISLSESTLVGRLLYMVDSLPLLLEYPFGTGYMGYYYLQSEIQTGLYSVMYVHNDLLQLLLDIGWLPVAVLLGALCRFFCSKTVTAHNKLIAATVLVHALLDFDLQFIFILLLLIYLLDDAAAATRRIGRVPMQIGAIAVAAVSLYMAAALLLARVGLRTQADALYPFNTQNQLAMLEQERSLEKADQLSLRILSENTACYLPYSIQAQCAYLKGDIAQAIQNKRIVLQKAPFCYGEYEQYCLMLIHASRACLQNGDIEGGLACQKELCQVAQQLADAEQRMSKLGKAIKDQPRFELPKEIQDYVNGILSVNGKG